MNRILILDNVRYPVISKEKLSWHQLINITLSPAFKVLLSVVVFAASGVN